MIALIYEELNEIQHRAFIESDPYDFYHQQEIKSLIQENGVRFVEDFLEEDVDYELDDFDDIFIYKEQVRYNCHQKSYKNIVQMLIVSELDLYIDIYSIIGIDLPSKQWNMLFEILHQYYQEHQIEEYFLEDMASLNRFAISISLLRASTLDLSSYLDCIGYLESTYLKIDDLLEIKRRLNQHLTIRKVVDFESAKKKVKVDK